jgi:asparagine N-glycosylation enzyme membrane subunit Stt3
VAIFFFFLISPQLVPLLPLLAPFPLWLALMTLNPHKEERFMAVVYPFIALSAAVAVVSLSEIAVWFGGKGKAASIDLGLLIVLVMMSHKKKKNLARCLLLT